MSNQSTDKITREARNQYYREYRAKNREKIRAINKRYWERRAAREQEATANAHKTNQIQDR